MEIGARERARRLGPFVGADPLRPGQEAVHDALLGGGERRAILRNDDGVANPGHRAETARLW